MKNNIIYILFSIIGCFTFYSCSNENVDDVIPKDVEVTFSYSIDEPSYYSGLMRTSRGTYKNESDSIFTNVFKPKIEDGELLGTNIDLTFSEVNNEDNLIKVSTEKGKSVILKTGKYAVSGTIGTNSHGNGCSGNVTTLYVNDTIMVNSNDSNIVLHGEISGDALIICDTSFIYDTCNHPYNYSDHFNSSSLDMYEYMFVNYFVGYEIPYLKIDGTKYTIKWENGKYYYFKTKNDTKILNTFDMENGFE